MGIVTNKYGYPMVKNIFNVKWKVGLCNVGENCWCRMILTEDSEDVAVTDGAIDRETAEYIVMLHNSYIK